MTQTLDERARDASNALRAAAELRPTEATTSRPRTTLRVALTAAVVVVVIVVGAVAVIVGATRRSAPAAHTGPRYEASAVLLQTAAKHDSQVALQQDQLMLTTGVVPVRSAAQLHFTGKPETLLKQIHSTIDLKVGTITITSTQATSGRAMAIVNTFATQLAGYLHDVANGSYNLQVVAALQRVTTVKNLEKPVAAKIAVDKGQGRDNPILEAESAALIRQLQKAEAVYQRVLVNKPADPYRVIEATQETVITSP